jgi:hypothetical protein
LRAGGGYAMVVYGKGMEPKDQIRNAQRPPADEQHATQRITNMAMKKKKKAKKAAKKS